MIKLIIALCLVPSLAYGWTRPATNTVNVNTLATATLNCVEGQIPKRGSQGWGCSSDSGTQADWDATEGEAVILNKPTIPDQLSDLSDDATHRLVSDTEKTEWSNKADLDENGKVPTSQLPSFADTVAEYANLAAFPGTGASGTIYVALDTNKTYRWGGTSYVELSQSLALGETSSSAYRGDRGKTAYDHSQLTHVYSEADPSVNALGKASLSCSSGQTVKWGGSSWACAADNNTGTWGSISGTLSSQSDLNTALSGKSSTSHLHPGTYEPANANIQSHVTSLHAPANAEQNVQADWNATSGDAYILNKPTIPTATSQLTNNSGFLTNLASPGPIGSTTPDVGTFTGLTVNGGINVVGSSTPDGEWGQFVFQSDNGTNWVLFHPEADFTENYTVNIPNQSGTLAMVVTAPTTAADTCKAGAFAYASGYVYICVATNTWKRAALSTW